MKSEISKNETSKNEELKINIDIYTKILDLRKFEIENFWKRTLFFWGTLAILLVAYFKQAGQDKYLVCLSLIGLLYNIIFSLSIRGSKYWQEHWEVKASEFENKLQFKLLNDDSWNPTFESRFTYPYRFSVSKLTMLLSDLTVLMWFMFWLKDFINLFRYNYLKMKLNLSNSIDFFTVGVIVFHIILLLYFYNFLKFGNVYYKTTMAKIV